MLLRRSVINDLRLIVPVLMLLCRVSCTSISEQLNAAILKTTHRETLSIPSQSRAYVYKSYQTSVYCESSSPIQYPENVNDVQEIVKQAVTNGQKVKAVGSRHSITDIICTDGIPMSLQAINYTILNEDETVTVGGGAEVEDVLLYLHEQGRSLIHVPAFGGITVAGAIGTGAHGSSLLHATSLSDQAVKFTVVDGMGNIRIISDGEDLKAFGVHLGLLGAIIDVTLKTVPLFKMIVHNTLESEEILLNGRAIVDATNYDWFQIWWFPSTKNVVMSRGNYTNDLSLPGNARTNMIPDQTPTNIEMAVSRFETLQSTRNKQGLFALQNMTETSLHTFVSSKPPLFTEDGQTLVNPAVGYAYRLQANKCSNKCGWDNGNYSLNPEESAMAFDLYELPNVISSMKNILEQVQATFPMVGIFIRFSKASDALMAIENGRDTVHVEWATPMRTDPYADSRDGIGAYQAFLQTMLKSHRGRPHWGKNGPYYNSKDVIAESFPNRANFVNFIDKYDPNGTFMNKFGRRLKGESSELTFDPNVIHCAIQDYCICELDTDCAQTETCTLISGSNICLEN